MKAVSWGGFWPARLYVAPWRFCTPLNLEEKHAILLIARPSKVRKPCRKPAKKYTRKAGRFTTEASRLPTTRPTCLSVAASSCVADSPPEILDGMSRLKLGDFEISLVQAGFYWWDGGAMFGVVPRTLWSKKFEPDEQNRVRLAFNCYIIQTDGHTILVETGAGDKPGQKARERMKLPTATPPMTEIIRRHGIDPDSVDIVINTHLHFDHCGGNTILTDTGARPTFPQARYYTRRGEWEHAHERDLRDKVSYIDANYDPLIESGHMQLIDEDLEVVPGVRVTMTPGHNRD